MTCTVTDLACARGGVTLLEGVSFTLRPGAALCLRGPNGIGKTTLLRCIAGLQPPLGGSITLPPESVAYAAHADGVKATLTVAENLTFWAAVHGSPGIAAAMEALDLTALRDRPARELSAGQRRRLGLARLIVTRRPLWVLDEPTVSLDAASVARFAAVVQAHLGQGGMALIATHIDLGLEADTLELAPFKARPRMASSGFDEAFA